MRKRVSSVRKRAQPRQSWLRGDLATICGPLDSYPSRSRSEWSIECPIDSILVFLEHPMSNEHTKWATRRSSPECAVKILQLVKIPQGHDLESFTELLSKRRHSEAVTSLSRDDNVVVTINVVVIGLTPPPLSVIVEGAGEELDVFISSSSSSSGNVGREIDTLEFESVDFVSLSSSSSSSSPKGETPITLVPALLLWTPGLLPPPRILRRKTGPRTRITSATIALTFASIL